MQNKNRNNNKGISQILSYLRKNLSQPQRNRLQRELQKDEFEADAMEGFELIHPDELEEDLQKLDKRLSRRLRKTNRILFIRMAASLVVILAFSGIYFYLNRERDEVFDIPGEISQSLDSGHEGDSSYQEITMEKGERKVPDSLEKTIEAGYVEKQATKEITEKSFSVAESAAPKKEKMISAEEDVFIPHKMAASRKTSIPAGHEYQGIILSAMDSLPLSNVEIINSEEFLSLSSDAQGFFHFVSKKDSIFLFFQLPGFKEDSLKFGSGDSLRLYLEPLVSGSESE